jgi:hypothetical protein
MLVASEKPMPTETHRVHLPWDDPRCDTLEILNMAARQGRRYVDLNSCTGLTVPGSTTSTGSGPGGGDGAARSGDR